VQSANSLRFPLWYIDQRKHISILIRDGPESNSSEYPTSIKAGSPAAWAYAHDDLSLASLHVAEVYRRTGLGRICVNLMGKKLIQAQKEALAKCFPSSEIGIPTPFLLDTEMHKGTSRLFFEAQGFNGIVVATWGSLLVTSPCSAKDSSSSSYH
jgi:GNAT superfamily N-acetyltransferase